MGETFLGPSPNLLLFRAFMSSSVPGARKKERKQEGRKSVWAKTDLISHISRYFVRYNKSASKPLIMSSKQNKKLHYSVMVRKAYKIPAIPYPLCSFVGQSHLRDFVILPQTFWALRPFFSLHLHSTFAFYPAASLVSPTTLTHWFPSKSKPPVTRVSAGILVKGPFSLHDYFHSCF